jgi:hypothetical protein
MQCTKDFTCYTKLFLLFLQFSVLVSDQGRPTSKTCVTSVSFTIGQDIAPQCYLGNQPTSTFTWNISENAFQTNSQYNAFSARDADLQAVSVNDNNVSFD